MNIRLFLERRLRLVLLSEKPEKADTHEGKKKRVGNCSQRCTEELFYFGMTPGSSGALVQDSVSAHSATF